MKRRRKLDEFIDTNHLLERFPVEGCSHCRKFHRIYKERLNPGLVVALRRFALAVEERNVNCIHPRRDLAGTPYDLSHEGHSNFQKLRLHGLVVQCDKDYVRRLRPDAPRNKQGKPMLSGYWLITRRGGAFLRGEPIAHSVIVLHGHPIATYPQDGTTTMRDFNLENVSLPHFDDITYYAGEGRLF